MNVYKKRDEKPTSSSGKYKTKIMRQKSKLSEKLYSMAQCNGQFYIAATVANQWIKLILAICLLQSHQRLRTAKHRHRAKMDVVAGCIVYDLH